MIIEKGSQVMTGRGAIDAAQMENIFATVCLLIESDALPRVLESLFEDLDIEMDKASSTGSVQRVAGA